LGHRVARVNFFNQNDVVLVKKKQKSTGCNMVFNRVLPGQPGSQVSLVTLSFFFSIFYLTRPGSSSGSTRRAGFQNYDHYCTFQHPF
jgi:hypothetical protein